MTKKEKVLLEIARQVIMMNEGCALTGSLLLAHLGLPKRREAHDIDIVTKKPIIQKDGGLNCGNDFKLQKGFFQSTPVYPNELCVSFRNEKLDITIDFLYSPEEEFVNFHNIPCGSVIRMIQAKEFYSKQPSQHSEKHKLDLKNDLQS